MRMTLVIGLVVVASLLAGSASAASIAIANASFDSPALADGADAPLPADWGGWMAYYYGAAPSCAIWNAPGSEGGDNGFIGASGDGTPQGGSGANVFYIVNTPSGSSDPAGAGILQHLSSVVQAGTYTLTVGVGVTTQRTAMDVFQIGIGANWTGTDAAYYAGTSAEIAPGHFTDKSVTWTVDKSSQFLGDDIGISLRCRNDSSSKQAIEFDNVRLDFVAAPVPEPGTILLLATGVIGLVCYAWRKRND